MNAQDAKLIYVGDPMCSWCYGFAPELAETVRHFEGKVDIELVMGGLRPYYDKKMIEMKDFLSHHWEEVNKASGQKFSYGILDRTDLAYDTEPPARAVVVVRSMDPSKEYAFFSAVQIAFYYDNLDMNTKESYHAILKELGLSTADFDAKFGSQEMKNAIKQDFARASSLGVSSFPTLLIQRAGETPKVAARGYLKSEALISKLSRQLSH